MKHLLSQLSSLGGQLAVAELHIVHAFQQNRLLVFASLQDISTTFRCAHSTAHDLGL